MPFSSPARARSSLSRGDLTFVVCVCVCADRFCGRIVSWGKAFHEVKYLPAETDFDGLVIKNSEFLMSGSMSTVTSSTGWGGGVNYFDTPARCIPVSRIAFQGLLLEYHSILADAWSMGRQWLPRMWLRAHPVCTAGHANRLGMTKTYAAVEAGPRVEETHHANGQTTASVTSLSCVQLEPIQVIVAAGAGAMERHRRGDVPVIILL
jgi:hypothetical protein